jgi:hypothetical protein
VTTVGFEIESDVPPPPVANQPENANYWRKEIRARCAGAAITTRASPTCR